MNKWLRRLRGAVGMGLLWGAGGAGIGMLIELIANIVPGFGAGVDIWPAVLGVMGFIGGGVFSVVLGIVAARRRFDELSLPWFTAWGAAAGLLAGALLLALGAPAIFVGVTTLGSAVGASGSLVLARMAERRESPDAELEAPDPEKRLGGGR